ncbi:MAG TPA: DUF2461 family protein [Blastocatellia bacterium]
MGHLRFSGFSAGLFQFLSALAENNSREWFDAHRRQYQSEVLAPVKSFVADLGPIIHMLNESFDTEARVGRTISRINNDLRFHRNRPPYRPWIYVGFPRRGENWMTGSLLFAGLEAHGVSVGFYPGGKPRRTGAVQEGIRRNLRLFERYLDERQIAENYWELANTEQGPVQKWPLPKTARRWVKLDSFVVGEHFSANDPILSRRRFLDRAQKILLDLYPLWLFATSDNVKDEYELYNENIHSLKRPLSRAAG